MKNVPKTLSVVDLRLLLSHAPSKAISVIRLSLWKKLQYLFRKVVRPGSISSVRLCFVRFEWNTVLNTLAVRGRKELARRLGESVRRRIY